MRQFVLVLCLIWASLLLRACSDEAQSPEEEIRQFIDTGVEAAEARSVDGLEELIHADYRDQKGYSKNQLTNLMRGLFFRHKKVFLFTRIEEINLISEGEAIVNLKVAMAGSQITGLEALTNLRAQLYAFELHLLKTDDWLLQHAKWRRASLADFE